MTNLYSILKSRDITLPTKVRLVKAMVFPVVMYGCESWSVKKAEHQRMMLLNYGVGEDSWESLGLQGDPASQSWRKSVLNIHWKDWCWSWNSSTLATWYEELTPWKRPSLMLREIEGRRRRGWQRMRWLDGITDSIDVSLVSQRVRHDWATELNWGTDVFCVYYFNQSFLQYTGLETVISTVLQRGYWITHINIK